MARDVRGDLNVQRTIILDGDPGTLGQIPASQGPGQPTVWTDLGDSAVLSVVSGITGADRVTKVVSLSQAEYNSRSVLADDSTTLFIVEDSPITTGITAALAAGLAIALG